MQVDDEAKLLDAVGTRAARALSALIHRRAGTITLLALLVTVLAGVLASRLRIDQELRRLLPEDFPSVTRLDRMSQRLGQQSDLYVTIRSPSRAANVAFGQALEVELEGQEGIAEAVFRRDLRFFEDRALLYASLADLVDLRRRVILRIREEVRERAYGDFGTDEEEEAGEDGKTALGFDTEALERKYGASAGASEYMEADEGRVMVLKIRPTQPSTDLAFAHRLTSAVRERATKVGPERFHPEMTVELDGAYVQHTGRVNELRDDVIGGSLAAAAALLLTLAVYFRSVRGIALVAAPLLGSVLGALAFATLAFGYLNLVSAFIFAVLLGLGIDFGIHVLARLRFERGRGLDSHAALTLTLATSGWTTVAGGLSTALAFAVLIVADFQGFAQFGQVAAVGICFALVAAVIVMPAMVVVFDRVWLWRPPLPDAEESRRPAAWRGLRVLAIVVAAVGIAFAAWALPRLDELEYEHDLRELGPVREAPEGPQPASYRDAVGKGRTVDPILALVDSSAQAKALQEQLDALLAMTPEEVAAFDPASPPTRPLPEPPRSEADAFADETGDFDDDIDDFGDEDFDDPRFVAIEETAVREAVMSRSTAVRLGAYDRERLIRMRERLHSAWSLQSFVPPLQAEKLAVIADIRARIDAKRGSLSAESEQEIDEWYRYLQVDAPIQEETLPAWIRAQFEDREGQVGRSVLLATRGSKADITNARELYALFGSLPVGDETVETAAEFYVIPEIFDTIERDGPIVMVLALGVMMVTAVILLQRIGAAFAVAVTIGLALVWLAGIMLALDWRLNFFNIIVLPLLLGMGQDDALHLAERYEELRGDLRRTLKEAGGAILVTTLTTIWGFSGILFANHRGLHSLALTAVIGMTLALIASVVILPLLLGLGARLRARFSPSRAVSEGSDHGRRS